MTLIEVVLAITVIAVGMSVLLTAISFAGKAVYTARNQVAATQFARQQIEARRIYNFRDTNLNVGTYTVIAQSGTAVLYRATVNISSNAPKEKLIRVQVPWTNFVLRAARTASYDTIIVDAIH